MKRKWLVLIALLLVALLALAGCEGDVDDTDPNGDINGEDLDDDNGDMDDDMDEDDDDNGASLYRSFRV